MSLDDTDTDSSATEVEERPGQAGDQPARRTRKTVIGAAAVGVGLLVAGIIAWPEADDAAEPVSVDEPSATVFHGWLSGASGAGVVEGDFGEWRGSELEISGIWADKNSVMTRIPQLREDAPYGDWDRPLDVAIGAISEEESWEDAADGDYDERWRESLETLRERWGDRDETMFIRFAHESNGDWYPWRVTSDNYEAFIESWRRFREMQQEIFPEAQLVFCVNRESVDTGMDWRESFPGSEYVDVFAVDYYNQYPYVDSAEEWQDSLTDTDRYGAPKGLEQHRQFAAEVGLPMAVPEWSGNADEGDSPAFIRGMHSFFTEYAGSGPGELMYEIQFNWDKDERRWLLYGESEMPDSAEVYRELF